MIEHNPWIGESYREGIGGKRCLIVGYSHHDENGVDTQDMTTNIVSGLVDGNRRGVWYNFFSVIRNRFGFHEHAEFWPRVAFMNFVPSIVGTSDERYAVADSDQNLLGNRRLARVTRELEPDRVFVFSYKAWHSIKWDEHFPSGQVREVASDGYRIWIRELIVAEDQRSVVVGLPHPQGAARAHYSLLAQIFPDHQWS